MVGSFWSVRNLRASANNVVDFSGSRAHNVGMTTDTPTTTTYTLRTLVNGVQEWSDEQLDVAVGADLTAVAAQAAESAWMSTSWVDSQDVDENDVHPVSIECVILAPDADGLDVVVASATYAVPVPKTTSEHDSSCGGPVHYECGEPGCDATYDGWDCGHVQQPTPVSPGTHGTPYCDEHAK